MLHGVIKYSLLSCTMKELYNSFCCSFPNKYILLKYFWLKIDVSCSFFPLILKWTQIGLTEGFSKDILILCIFFRLNLKRLPLLKYHFKLPHAISYANIPMEVKILESDHQQQNVDFIVKICESISFLSLWISIFQIIVWSTMVCSTA